MRYPRTPHPEGELQKYQIYFPRTAEPRDYPVKGCQGRAEMRTGLCVDFLHRHMWDTVIIYEEVNLPYPWYPCCDMLVPWASLNVRHHNTAQCAKGAERKRYRLAEEEIRART